MQFRTRALALVATTAAVLVLGACATPQAEETGDAPGLLGTVDTMFGTIEVPEPEGELRVVALGWSDAEMALALGVQPVAVYDWQGFGAENKGVGPWATELFGDVEPELIERSDQNLNYEQIELLDPDLILNTRSANDEQVWQRLQQIAPTVYAPESTAAFATEWDVQLTSIASALGLADEGEALIQQTRDRIEQAGAEHPELAGLTTASVAKFGDAYGAYLAGDGRFDILADLGMVNNPPILELEASGFYAPVSLENVSVFNADVIVVLPIGYTLAETTGDELLGSLEVVQDGRAIFLDPADDLDDAYSAGSVLSIGVVLDELVPMLADAAARLG